MNHVVGGGGTSALHAAFQFNQIWRSRVVLPPEPELKELVHDVVTATTLDVTQLQQAIEELKGLRADFAEERAERTLKSSPYSNAWRRYGPETKEQWYSLIDTLIGTLSLILMIVFNSSQPQLPTFDQEQQIVQQLQQMEKNQEQEIEQLKEINKHLAENEAKEHAKPSKEHR